MRTEVTGSKMYFAAIVLPKHLDEKIRLYKKQMQERYRCKVGLKSPAHITIVPPFWTEEEKEEALVADLQIIAGSLAAFALETDGFSAFKSRTIFVAVQHSHELDAVKKRSDEFFRAKEYKMKFQNRPFHPHITIATRDIMKKDFFEIWPWFQQQQFGEIFEANGLSLLKHNGSTWDVIFTAPFQYQYTTESKTNDEHS